MQHPSATPAETPPEAEVLYLARCLTPVGPYVILTSGVSVVWISPEDDAARPVSRWQRWGARVLEEPEPGRAAVMQLEEYFAGKRRRFSPHLDLRGTPFQCQVWGALLAIPYGETRTYLQIAQAIGRPGAVRAVGQAIGANPLSIVVPCHRVIGSDGSLTGYGGGLERKRHLLELEARVALPSN
ncbi:MAG: methylated-DNA--[protein]-cysteine S-methyltransferase [Chloroflexi bacterium]|nr:methylated-DNA--[protein]-cysteine S-methyltransferase [Chloroflexota bacterium]